jgi:hypothetical protein
MKWFKGLRLHWKIVVILLLLGVVAWIKKDPFAAGKEVGDSGSGIGDFFNGVADFFVGLVS